MLDFNGTGTRKEEITRVVLLLPEDARVVGRCRLSVADVCRRSNDVTIVRRNPDGETSHVKFKTAELMPENEPIETVLVWDLDGPAPAACRDGRPLKISDESDRSWPPQG